MCDSGNSTSAATHLHGVIELFLPLDLLLNSYSPTSACQGPYLIVFEIGLKGPSDEDLFSPEYFTYVRGFAIPMGRSS